MPGEVTEGETITVNCTVESNPASALTLRRMSNDQTSDIHPSDDYLPESNPGKFTFNVTSQHSGSYACRARNSEGSNQSREIRLLVKCEWINQIEVNPVSIRLLTLILRGERKTQYTLSHPLFPCEIRSF